jgi:Na+-transporting methylmalonyl-CoA/oxaloacetate decarboxylase gamma subunit
MLNQSLQLMLYGLAGVFSSLAIFFVMVKILTAVFKPKPEPNPDAPQ